MKTEDLKIDFYFDQPDDKTVGVVISGGGFEHERLFDILPGETPMATRDRITDDLRRWMGNSGYKTEPASLKQIGNV